jgi:hypothetical protein
MAFPDGKVVDAVEVDVEETTERWTDVKLTDGTTLRVKMTVIGAMRAVDTYDASGQPMYNVNMAPVIAVTDVPERLKKKVN